MHLSLNAVACVMRTKHSRVQDRRAHSARYAESANVMWFDLDSERMSNTLTAALRLPLQGGETAVHCHCMPGHKRSSL